MVWSLQSGQPLVRRPEKVLGPFSQVPFQVFLASLRNFNPFQVSILISHTHDIFHGAPYTNFCSGSLHMRTEYFGVVQVTYDVYTPRFFSDIEINCLFLLAHLLKCNFHVEDKAKKHGQYDITVKTPYGNPAWLMDIYCMIDLQNNSGVDCWQWFYSRSFYDDMIFDCNDQQDSCTKCTCHVIAICHHQVSAW